MSRALIAAALASALLGGAAVAGEGSRLLEVSVEPVENGARLRLRFDARPEFRFFHDVAAERVSLVLADTRRDGAWSLPVLDGTPVRALSSHRTDGALHLDVAIVEPRRVRASWGDDPAEIRLDLIEDDTLPLLALGPARAESAPARPADRLPDHGASCERELLCEAGPFDRVAAPGSCTVGRADAISGSSATAARQPAHTDEPPGAADGLCTPADAPRGITPASPFALLLAGLPPARDPLCAVGETRPAGPALARVAAPAPPPVIASAERSTARAPRTRRAAPPAPRTAAASRGPEPRERRPAAKRSIAPASAARFSASPARSAAREPAARQPASAGPAPTAVGEAPAPASGAAAALPGLEPLEPPADVGIAPPGRSPARPGTPAAPRAAPELPPLPARPAPAAAEVPQDWSAAERAFRQATRHQNAGHLLAAEQALVEALRIAPGHHEARERLAKLRIGYGDRGGAVALLRAGHALAPGHAPFGLLLARLLVDHGDAPAARYVLETSVGASDDPELQGFLAALVQAEGDHLRAAELFTSALRARPGRSAWWMGLAISLDAQEHRASALKAFQASLDLGTLDAATRRWVMGRVRTLRDELR